MIFLQLSAGQGPLECCTAVGLALKEVERECQQYKLEVSVVEVLPASATGTYKSVLLCVNSEDDSLVKRVISAWQGVMVWICQSPYRPKHKRKNWFFSGEMFEVSDTSYNSTITFQTCRASGAGGQHVNTTDSAVRATHTETGLTVRVESERSQHANKRLARALLLQKLQVSKRQAAEQQEHERWQQHQTLQRGAPVKTFKGRKFVSE